METANSKGKRSLSKPASSFRLRCPSLNSVRLRRVFDLFDKNHDDTITVNEISQALNRLGLDSDLSELDTLVKPYIKPGNAGLRFEEFESLHRSINDKFFGLDDINQDPAQEESDLSEAFKVFDEDGDGYISAKELQLVLRKLGLAEGGEIGRVEKMISGVDRDHDGRVDYFEFKDMMRSVTVRTA